MVFDYLCSRLRVNSMKINVNLFPSSIKTHKSDKRSLLDHKFPIIAFYIFIVFSLFL